MRNEEQLLGFDSREMWSQMDATWPESRKALYLVRADVTKVLSVDSLVWPRVVLGVEKNTRAPTQWRDLGLWENLHHLREYLQQNAGAIGRPYQVIGITLLRNALPMHEQEMWAALAPSVPASLTKEWMFLGYDVADEGFISGLSDCAYEADELHLRTGWELSLNEWHLFTQRRQAIKFKRMTDQRVDEHAPSASTAFTHFSRAEVTHEQAGEAGAEQSAALSPSRLPAVPRGAQWEPSRQTTLSLP